ncbi:MAG: MmgE/PrpD family protein [Burkholderiales bacterium]|nr:MmgE/PrpD family protein [Burkholderiales bacterium]
MKSRSSSEAVATDERITQALAERICGLRPADVPEDVIGTAKACLLDTLGVALLGAQEDATRILRELLAEFGDRPQATIVGAGAKTSVPNAALIKGTAAHALDFDDMHIAASMHPSAPVIPAALAMAEHLAAGGRDTLTAIALGMEVELRLGVCVNPAHYERGWHATATLGRFGAAAAAGHLLKLNPHQMAMAIGLAGTQAAGLKEVFGTMAKPLHAGQAARDGVLAALLAAR